MSLEPNILLNNRYRILEQLGSGGMGAVYRAHDENLDVEVAVKENFFVSDESARQFQREAHLLFELRHRGLPRVIDHFVVEDQGQYLVMDFIEGDDANQVLERNEGPLDEELVVRWGVQILDALKYLHSREPPVIHRDIKPSNIKVTTSGRAMLVDFGLAKEYDPTKSTTVGAKAYTPGFAPPEQYGQGRTDRRTDIYSFGTTLYNLLTDKIPEDGLQRAMGQARLIPVRDLNQSISPHVAAAIERATEVRPENRFDSVEALQASLIATPTVAESPATVLHPSTEVVEPAKPRRSILPLAIGAIVLLAIGLGAGLFLTGGFANLGGAPPPSTTPLPPTNTSVPVVIPPTEAPTDTSVPDSTNTPAPTATAAPTESPTPANTPVGGGTSGEIAFASEREGIPQIFLMNIGQENLVQLTSLADGACQPAWSPEGDRLLFTTPCRQKDEEYPNAAIWIMNADGSSAAPLISLIGGVYDAAWSKSGIAFTYLETGRPSLWMAEPDGSALQKITAGTSRDRQPTWAPGEDKLALMNTSRAGSATLFWVFSDGSFNGSNPDQVTRDQISSQPDWSPSGEFVAYTSNQHIWVVPWDSRGFGAARISDRGPNDGAAWSPDGHWLAFESWRDAANHDIYIMTANGGQPTRLTNHDASDYHPAWRP